MGRRGWSFVVVIAALTLGMLPARASITDDIRSKPFSMTETDLTHGEAEPSLALDSKDHVLFCGPVGIPGGQYVFMRSTDWTNFDHQIVTDRAGGGDCDIATGPNGAGGDRVYAANLQAAASAIRVSNDDGVTFNSAIEDPIEQDRMWLAADPVDSNVVYMGYHDFTGKAIVVIKSTDGGQTFPIHSVASIDPNLIAQDANGTTPGRLRIDPTDHNRLYIVWSTTSAQQRVNSAQQQNAFASGNQLIVARSDDAGLTWSDHFAMDLPVGSVLPNVIPALAVDQAGDLYAVAAGSIVDGSGKSTNGLFYASSTDHGVTWSAPVQVNAGDPGAVVFPTVIAGARGIADFVWLSSSATTTADTSGVWSVHFAQTRDALDAAPAFTIVDGPVVHKGDICTKGILCQLGGDRSLLDFADMALDSFGYAHIAVYATERGIKAAPHVLYWRQDAGPSATSEPGDGGIVTARPGPR